MAGGPRRRRLRLAVLGAVIALFAAGAVTAYALTRPTSPRSPGRVTVAATADQTGPLTTTGGPAMTQTRTVTLTTAGRASTPTRTVKRPTPGCRFHESAARAIVEDDDAHGLRVGLALSTAAGRILLAVNAGTPNYGASITKSMLLVAYLRDHAAGGLSATSVSELSSMIEVSDNEAADWVYAHLTSPRGDVEQVADDAGMTGFHLDTTDPVYTLGQSLITARDFARFFAQIAALMPAGHRAFGMSLLAHVEERVGLLAAGLPGTVYSKEGWKPEPAGLRGAPYVVNQAARFSCRGETYGLAVTVGAAPDQTAAQDVVQRVAAALIGS